MPSIPSKPFFSTALSITFLAVILIPICHSIDEQGQALLEWKRSLNNSVSANSLSSWKDTDSSPCNDWLGVKCDEKGRVVELSLKSVDLQGTLPSNFRLLESLATLVLSSANLTGKIPSEIGDSVELVVLDLSDNFLTGEIPSELFRLKKLETLSLNTNFLEGPIPEVLGELSSLVSLTLFDNRLAGEIPRSVGELRSLEILRAGGNKNLKGPIPAEIGNCESLVVLGLAETGISGSIPASIGNLKRVQTIAVYTSLLSGPIPDEIGNCTELKNLYLYQNSLSGSIPGSIARLKSLESVLLWENSLVGTIPREIGNCSRLRVLDLSENLLVGAIPSSIGDLSKLEEFQLSVNKLSGAIPLEISRCSALNHLEIDNNEISGEIPGEFGELKRLTVLFAWKNRLSGNIPARLSECESLQALDLSYNSLSGGIPGEIFGLTNLTKLLLLSNELTGFIPAGIGNCTSLYRLRLNQNRISGAIPPEIGGLTSLNFLDLSENRLAGPIPRTISGCRSLEFLDLHSNGISGPLPEILPKTLQFADFSTNRLEGPLAGATVAPLTELTKLSLAGNRLVGGIPPELRFCVRLQLLNLGGNFFSGDIPAEIGRIPSLEISLNLSCNQLSGELPRELAGLDKLGVLDISRNNLSGGLESLSGLENLVSLNVSHNAFSGKIPDTPFFRKLPLSDVNPNAGLFAGPTSDSDHRAKTAAEASPAMKFLTSVLISASAVLVLLAIYLILRTRMVTGAEASAEAQPWEITFYQKTEISVDDVIRQLTSANVIGTGSSGVVYRVSLPSGGEWVAVKKMWSSTSTEESASAAAFGSEIRTLGSVRHKNIVRLLGWGSNQAVKLLFYDYLPNGSLSSMISGGAAEWETRYEVVLGVAHALAYLHHDCVPAIMHGDVKAMNVLLGHRNQPFLADFGLARVLSGGGAVRDNDNVAPLSLSPPHLAGSYGYMAPEHGSMQKITEKSDVYSFGVVLLEVLTGRHPLDPSLPGGSHLVQWVRDHLASKKEPSEILDPRLKGRSDPAMHEMLQTLAVSFLCVAARAHDRPAMKDVVAMLAEIRHVSNDDENASRLDVEFGKKSKTTLNTLTSSSPKNMSAVSTRGSSDCSFAFSDDYSMSK